MTDTRKRSLPDDGIVVQLLCTNDTHSQLEPFEPTKGSEQGSMVGGVAQRAALFEVMRGECPATITLDAGDFLVGTPFFEFMRGEADLIAMRELGYDAVAIGNHDFDGSDAQQHPADGKGLDYLKRLATRHAPGMRLLCGNVQDEATGEAVFAPHAVFEPPGVRVGVAAVLGPQAWEVTEASGRKGLKLEDFISAAQRAAAALREAGCDVLVCLSHTGVERGDREACTRARASRPRI